MAGVLGFSIALPRSVQSIPVSVYIFFITASYSSEHLKLFLRISFGASWPLRAKKKVVRFFLTKLIYDLTAVFP